MPKSVDELRAEWAGRTKSWYRVYQWGSLNNSTYSEDVARILLDNFDAIELNAQGLRERNFKYSAHHGQGNPETWEKRFCRALFNTKTVPLLGDVLDYEVPLKEKQSGDHGDIDVVVRSEAGLLITEAKAYNSQGSLLKAVLQAFTYTALVSTARARFTSAFGVPKDTRLIPTVLVFECADEGSNLLVIDRYPQLKALIGKLKQSLANAQSGEVQFYLVRGDDPDVSENCMVRKQNERGAKRVVFVDGFTPELQRITVAAN